MCDLYITILGRKWEILEAIEHMHVIPDEGEELDDEFVVVDPTTRRILVPTSFTHQSLGTAVLRAIEIEEELQRKTRRTSPVLAAG